MLALLFSAALAAPISATSSEALFQSYLDTFEPSAPDSAAGWDCATGLLLALRERWPEFTPAQRARMAARLSPGEPDPWSAPPRHRAPPPGAPADTCWGQNRDERLTSEHFAVEWMDGVTDAETAQGFLDDLEYAWRVEFEERGWRRPDGTDAYLMHTVIEPGGAGAYTTVKSCDGVYIPYIVAGEGSFSSARWARNMAAHELLHTSQFSYSYAHEFWWWEASATWLEELAYPDDNAWSESIPGYSLYPNIAMNAASQSQYDVFAHMYGMAVWGFYLDEYVGGPELVRQTWEYSAGVEGSYTLGMEDALEALGVDFQQTYEGFVATNAVMAYADQGYFLPPNIREILDALPASWTASSSLPETLGQTYLRVDAGAATDALPDLEVSFSGDAEREWLVLLVADDKHEIQDQVRLEVTGGEGVATMRSFGDYDYVWLVVSPLSGEGGGAFSVAVAATGLPEPDTGEVTAGGGCGCGAAPGGGAGALAALLAALAVWRRGWRRRPRS